MPIYSISIFESLYNIEILLCCSSIESYDHIYILFVKLHVLGSILLGKFLFTYRSYVKVALVS